MRRFTPFLAALLLAASALPVRAVPLPGIVAEVGRTFAVESPVSGAFDQGGFSMALSALWPAEDMLRIGVSAFADDIGSLTGERVDHSQSPPASLGVFDLAHANAYGGAWRMEVAGPRLRRLETFARGDWGIYWFRIDQYGTVVSKSVKAGWSLGGGVMLAVGENHAVGITIAFDRVFYDSTRDYMTAAFAWHWRPGSRPRAAGSKG